MKAVRIETLNNMIYLHFSGKFYFKNLLLKWNSLLI